MRRLHPPALAQWGCKHQWKTTTSRRGQGDVVRVRYLSCRRCGLKVKTEERLAVPWSEQDFMTFVAQAFPEGAMMDVASLQTQGVFGDGLAQLNVRLVSHGWQLEVVQEQGCVVGAVRRRMSAETVGGTILPRGKKKGER